MVYLHDYQPFPRSKYCSRGSRQLSSRHILCRKLENYATVPSESVEEQAEVLLPSASIVHYLVSIERERLIFELSVAAGRLEAAGHGDR